MPPLAEALLPVLAGTTVFGIGLAIALRRSSHRATVTSLDERLDAKRRGSHEARLQHPEIDLDQCIGCGACVEACPEEGVLAMLHGQAAVVHGARCVGHSLCADACPVSAVRVTLGDTSDRSDLPALNGELEAVGVPGLFVAGELGGYALVRTAIAQGTAVAEAVAAKSPIARESSPGRPSRERTPTYATVELGSGLEREVSGVATAKKPRSDATRSLLVVGAGPAGLACSLRARELGIDCVVIDQEDRVGGAVSQYPRAKLVMTQPVRLPLYGQLPRLSYLKEELCEVWEKAVADNDLDLHTSTRLTRVVAKTDGSFDVETDRGTFHARNVCLALGRRGTPRKLGVPGEDLSKVHYALLDAQSFTGKHVLVVGGGDSAIEAALGLAAQDDNVVTLSYRKPAFFRLKARNDKAIRDAESRGSIHAAYSSTVTDISADSVGLSIEIDGSRQSRRIPNDVVFVLAGGVPPFGLLEQAGVSFDPALRADESPSSEKRRGAGLKRALVVATLFALGVVAVGWWHRDYYTLGIAERPTSSLHEVLQPRGTVGLWFGVLSVLLILSNLAYLGRRSKRFGRFFKGSLSAWMSTHVFTGIAAFFCVVLHAAFAPRNTVGGHAFATMAVVVTTGIIGRYLYSFVPRATNGKELEVEELHGRIAAISGEWDRGGRGFGARVRESVERLIDDDRKARRRGLRRRILTVVRSRIALNREFSSLRELARSEGVPANEVRHLFALARRAHSLMLAAAHFAEARALLGSWRYLHRWLALLLVLLAGLHIAAALRFGGVDWSVLLENAGGSR